jgi:acetyl-CoA carboxylase, biotin carboxylase subunit
VDAAHNFYFLEVNTRLQVEHPVTEMVTGLDLVKLQLRVAAGRPLPFTQPDIALRGHAMECRLYAEDPGNHFFPSPGRLLSWRVPQGPGIRVDDGVYAGYIVPGDYDPLLGKLIAWGADRDEAIARLRRALEEFDAAGIKTNAGLFLDILADPEFSRGDIHTRWLDERLASLLEARVGRSTQGKVSAASPQAADAVAIAAVLWHLRHAAAAGETAAPAPASRWKLEGRREQISRGPER